MMVKAYYPVPLIEVAGLYTVHYFQFANGYAFPGERHDFWEMVYIDQGEADIGAGEQAHRLRQGQVIFHEPNEFHSIWANHDKGTNIFVISFACDNKTMDAFRRRVCTMDVSQRKIISRMIAEAQQTFGYVLDAPYYDRMIPLSNAPAGGAQMLAILLTQLLIDLFRVPVHSLSVQHQPTLTEEQETAKAVECATRLMRNYPNGNLCFRDICRETGLGGTALQKHFRRYTGCSVMAYYQQLRIEESRKALRKGAMNISQIAYELGYSSVQAFSRQFKRLLGVCPSEYLKMVRQ